MHTSFLSRCRPTYRFHDRLKHRSRRTMAVATGSCVTAKPVSDTSEYRAFTLDNGLRAVVVQDAEAVFAAACANVNAGYFDDPPDLPGLAHFLEHAVHLGSAKYPDEKDYKFFLSRHGGASNASTGMVHTQYHFKVHHQQLAGALDRLAQFFTEPLLLQDAAAREVENVHAEFSRNCNSDARKLLQLRRSTCQAPYSQFSTGNIDTLREGPAGAGVDMAAQLRSLWDSRYGADVVTAVVVGPQALDQLEALVRGSFGGVRPRGSGQARPWSWPAALPSDLGLLYRVAPQRELRSLEMQWSLPYGKMRDARCKPWSLVGHLLGHEAAGSVAAHLKQLGLVQALHTGMADDAGGPCGGGFMFWRCEVELTEAGLGQLPYVVAAVQQGLQLICSMALEQLEAAWREAAVLHQLRFDWRDRQEPVGLARALALQLHYWPPQELLAGPALLQEYDGEALQRFLSHLQPGNLNVYWSSKQHAKVAQQQEQWYGAKYCVEPLPQELKAALGLASSSSDGDCGSNGDCDSNGAAVNSSKGVSSAEAADAARQQQLDISAIRQHLHLPEPNWAIPKDLALKPPAAGAAVTPDSATTTTTSSTAASASGRPVSVHPAVAAQSPSLSLWHHQDTSFAIPKTHLYWHLVTPCVYASPTSLVTSRLLCRLLHDLLLPDTYHAELAGTHWELSTAATGLLLHVWGFSDVVGGLQGRVLRALAGLSLEQVQAWFDTAVGRQRQALQLWQQSNPIQHAEYAAQHLLQQPHWHTSELLAALEGLSAADVVQLSRQLRGQMYMEGLAYGNVTAAEAVQLAAQAEELMGPAGLAADAWPQPLVLQLGGSGQQQATEAAAAAAGEDAAQAAAGAERLSHWPSNPNPGNKNHALYYLLQLGPADARMQALLELFVQVASKPCFHQLRTTERLGYSVACTWGDMQGVVSVVVKVQAPADKPPALLRARVSSFLAGFRSHLEGLGQEQLQDFKASLVHKYLEPCKALSEAAGRPWAQLRTRRYDFSRRQDKAAAMQDLDLQALLGFYDTHIAPGAAQEKLLCVSVQGGGAVVAGAEGEAVQGQGEEGLLVLGDADVAAFKGAHACYVLPHVAQGSQVLRAAVGTAAAKL